MSNSNDLISAAEAAKILGITPVALYARRKRGAVPPWLDLAAPGNKRPVVRYSLTDILAFKDERLAALSAMAERVTPPEPAKVAAPHADRLDALADRFDTLADRLAPKKVIHETLDSAQVEELTERLTVAERRLLEVERVLVQVKRRQGPRRARQLAGLPV